MFFCFAPKCDTSSEGCSSLSNGICLQTAREGRNVKLSKSHRTTLNRDVVGKMAARSETTIFPEIIVCV